MRKGLASTSTDDWACREAQAVLHCMGGSNMLRLAMNSLSEVLLATHARDVLRIQ